MTIIGTVRAEEARVFDEFAGYHSFHAEETQEEYGSFEIFFAPHPFDSEDQEMPAGWYWQTCFPGCIPDSEPSGPFASSHLALQDADEWHPEFDE